MSTQAITETPPRPGLLARARASRWAPLPVVLTGTFMVVLDFFIVNVALPSMQANLHASSGAIEWVVAGYGLTSAVFLITAGRLGDRIGRAADVLARAGAVHAQLGGVRRRRHARGADRGPPASGRRRRAADAERAVDHRRPLHRRRPRPRAVGVRDGDGPRRRRRSADRRRARAGRTSPGSAGAAAS